MACLKKKRKPMMPVNTLDIIFRRRYVPNTQYYFSNRKHALKFGKSGYPPRPFQMPKSEKLLSYIKFSDWTEKNKYKRRVSQPLHLKDSYKISASRGISQRLFLEEPIDDVKAVVEIHPEFYNVIEGRPLRYFDDIKVYLRNIRSYAMYRQQIGYRRDIQLQLDKNMTEESRQYDKIMDRYKDHIKNFQRFLTEDYKKACSKQAKAEKVSADLEAKITEFLGYNSKITVLNNNTFELDAIRNTLKIYRSYLMFVAPLSWRQIYDETLSGKVRSIQFEAGQFITTENDLVETLNMDKIIEQAAFELKNPLPNYLYFKEPEEMMHIFRTMEMQSRDYSIQLAKTDLPHRILQERIKQLKHATKQELDYFQYYVDNINKKIVREEFNEQLMMNKFYRILKGDFFNTVASPDTLKLKICIEYVYEQIFGKCEEGHHSLREPMKMLELMYENYNMKLDCLDFKTVKKAQQEFFALDLKVMKNAENAKNELIRFREMTEAMNRAFMPPAQYSRPVVKNLGRKICKNAKKKVKGIGKDQKLSEAVQEDLLLFTDWCPGMDPAPYINEYNQYVKPNLTPTKAPGAINNLNTSDDATM